MSNSEKSPIPDEPPIQWDSLNSEVVEPTDVVVDTTVRPMREALRKRLKPTNGSGRPQEPPAQGSQPAPNP
jgi:hypothetical protein